MLYVKPLLSIAPTSDIVIFSIKSLPFGWEPDADGFRGHVFATPDNSTVVVSIKGTSAGLFGGGGPTAKKDKLNDNLLFSCCCAHVDWTWTTVCDCYRGGWKCDQTCLETALITESLFYPIGTVRFCPVAAALSHGICIRICTITSHTCCKFPHTVGSLSDVQMFLSQALMQTYG